MYLPIHAEAEGIARHSLFMEFPNLAASKQVRLTPLGDFLPDGGEKIPYGSIESRAIEGREGDVCWQASP